MAKPLPYYPFYVDDFESSEKVRAMSVEAVGLFLLCLNHSWREGSIPADPAKLAMALRVEPRVVKRCWASVLPCWIENGHPGRLVNIRQEDVRKDVHKRSEKAKNSADKRWGKASECNANAYANAMPRQSEGNARAFGLLSVSPGSEKQECDISTFDEAEAIGAYWDEIWAMDPYQQNEGVVKPVFMEILTGVSNPAAKAADLALNRKEWLEYCASRDIKPLGTIKWLQGDAFKPPPKKPIANAHRDPYRNATDAD